MPTLLLKYLRNIDLHAIYDSTSVIIILGLLAFVYQQHATIVEARAVYEHPQTKTIVKTRMVKGPVRIEIRYEKGEPVEKIIYRDTVTVDKTNAAESSPVPIAETLAPARTDRYLLSLGMNRLTPDIDGKALFVGYGFKNRVDVQVGGIEHNGFSPWVLATARF